MDSDDAADRDKRAPYPATEVAVTTVEQPAESSSHPDRGIEPQEAIAGAGAHPKDASGSDSSSAGKGWADLNAVNETLRAENDAFRLTIDENVSLKSHFDRLASSAETLEADRQTLQAQLDEARQRCDRQSKLIMELQTSITAGMEPGRKGTAEGRIVAQQELNDSSNTGSYDQKVRDLTALINQLNEDDRVKAALLGTKEVQLKEKQALYEDLKKKHGLEDTPSQPVAQTAQGSTRNTPSKSCLVM